jgi:flagellar assembly protein FliH
MSTSSKWPQPVQMFEYPPVIGNAASSARRKKEDEAERDALVRDYALREAETRWSAELERRVAEEREQLATALKEFRDNCDNYYRRVEGEVVQLSLAVARRILHREAKVDPLMLAGVVRVALDGLRAASEIKLHVGIGQAERWSKALAADGDKYRVTVIEEPLFGPAQCQLESNLGTVELGVDDQLKEIEHGFFDLLAVRPQ